MVLMSTLIDSSRLTRDWLTKIKVGVDSHVPSIIYDEVKYWAKFKNPNSNRVIAWLNPSKSSVRLFLKLDPDLEPDIKKSTSQWKNFPSIYRIDSENKVSRAIELVVLSFQYD